jgi:hypothetical protein
MRTVQAGSYLIPSSGDLAGSLTTEEELNTLKLLFAETLDILESEVHIYCTLGYSDFNNLIRFTSQ